MDLVESPSRSGFLIEHDLFGKPLYTFPDHAPGDIFHALMRRQSLVKFDAPLCETIVETPKPQGGEVLVRSSAAGCATRTCTSRMAMPTSAAARNSTLRAA